MMSYSSVGSSSPTPRTWKNGWVEDTISAISFIAVFSLLQLPYEKMDGNPVPAIIFNDRPAYFHAFVLGLNFAFAGGLMTIATRNVSHEIARIFRLISVFSMIVAVGVLICFAISLAGSGAVGLICGA